MNSFINCSGRKVIILNNLDLIQKELFRLTELERFQKNYFNEHHSYHRFSAMDQDNKIMDEHFKSVGHTVAEENYVNTLGMSNENFELPESHFFNEMDDVRITKHPRYSFPVVHLHSFFELLFVFSGQCINIIDGKKRVFSKGDLCVIPPKVEHSIGVQDDDSIILNILVKTSTFDQAFTSLLKSKDILSVFFNEILYSNRFHKYLIYHTGNDEILRELVLEMFKTCEEKGNYYFRIMNGYFTAFIGTLLQRHENHVEYPPGYFNKFDKTSQILNYIRANAKDITLNACAEKFHFSARYLSAILKKSTGKSLPQLINSARIETAKEILTYNQIALDVLADRLGYDDPSYFTKVFKKETGLTPSAYKNLHRTK